MTQHGSIQLFALASSRSFGERVSRNLGVELAEVEEREFEDGEHKARPLESVRGRDVYVVHSLYGDEEESVNDKLCRLLFFLGAVTDAGAGRVTALIPYLCYARKDRQTKSRDPITTRYVAQVIESVGTSRVVALDVHNQAAFQNAFRCPTEHLEALDLFAEHFAATLSDREVAVVSPDAGGIKRAGALQEALAGRLEREVTGGLMEKRRSRGVVSGEAFVGDVEERSVILVDDMISTGTTIVRAARACLDRGAKAVYAAATHGLFAGAAEDKLSVCEQVVVTNSIPPFRLSSEFVRRKLTVLDAAPVVASAVERLRDGDQTGE